MAIIQTKKQTDLEKRLKILRQQVYGKNTSTSVNQYTCGLDKTNTPSSDISYLYKDLTKILVMATSAIAFQVTLFIFMQRHLITLGF